MISNPPRTVEGGGDLLRNLNAEMARYGVTVRDIHSAIEKTERTARDKVRGKIPFSLPEAIKVRDKYFSGMSLEYLFAGSTVAGADNADAS